MIPTEIAIFPTAFPEGNLAAAKHCRRWKRRCIWHLQQLPESEAESVPTDLSVVYCFIVCGEREREIIYIYMYMYIYI